MVTLDIRPITKEEARGIVLPNHYSGTWNPAFGTFNFGVFDGEELCGAAVFGNMRNVGSTQTIADLPAAALVELNRLWIDDRFGANTETAFLSRCHKWLRQNTNVQLIQSFADGRLGCGTVYKAANYGYYGRDRTLFFRHRQTGEVYHGGPFTNTAYIAGMTWRNALWVSGVLEPFEAYTYRYLYPLTKYARRRIRLEREPYPAYHKGTLPLPNYRHPLALIARCQVACEATGDPRALKFMDYLRTNATVDEVFQLLAQANKNEHIAAIVEAERQRPRLFDMFEFGEATA